MPFHRCAPFRPAPHAPATDHSHAVTTSHGGKHLTVDIHCHMLVPAAVEIAKSVPGAQGSTPPDDNPLTLEINRKQDADVRAALTGTAERLASMDADGIDIQAISPSPGHYNYHLPAEVVRDTSRVVNDHIAEIVAGNPDRFVGMGTLPLQNCEMAVAELERCVKELDLRGVEISTNVAGKDLTRAGLEKFFAKAEELDVLIFIHPRGTTLTERMPAHYFRNTIGHPLESALAVGHLIFDGYMETYPGLKICVAHGGGYIPAYSGRFDHPWERRDDCRVNIPKPPSEYLKKMYFDTVVFTEHQLRYLIETWGADRIMLGTDYPFDMAQPDPVGHIRSVKGLSDDDAALVMGGNAARLLKIAR